MNDRDLFKIFSVTGLWDIQYGGMLKLLWGWLLHGLMKRNVTMFIKWRCYKVVWSIFKTVILSLRITRLWDILYKGMLKLWRGWLLRSYVIYLCKLMLQCLQGGDVTWLFEAFSTYSCTVELYVNNYTLTIIS